MLAIEQTRKKKEIEMYSTFQSGVSFKTTEMMCNQKKLK